MKYPQRAYCHSLEDVRAASALLEHERIAAWHATFNAALTGLISRTSPLDNGFCIAAAREAADDVHGAID